MGSSLNENTLYIFIDESGDFAFSEKGSKYFILTSVSTLSPLRKREDALNARYQLLREGFDIEYFHATEDAQSVRNVFYSAIKSPAYEVDSVVAEKKKANTSLYEYHTLEDPRSWKVGKVRVEERFYKQVCETLLQYVTRRYINLRPQLNIKQIVIVLDQCLTNKKREFVTKSIKKYIKENFGMVPRMYFHSSKADINSQIADYCCWALKKKWSDKEMRPYEEIRAKIKSEFEIFKEGTTSFY